MYFCKNKKVSKHITIIKKERYKEKKNECKFLMLLNDLY